MMTYSDLHLALSERLGWGAMLAKVAIPAINEIIANFGREYKHVHGKELTTEECGQRLLNIEHSDNIFGYLLFWGDDYFLYPMFLSLRGDIEHWMFSGSSHQEAIDEWFK